MLSARTVVTHLRVASDRSSATFMARGGRSAPRAPGRTGAMAATLRKISPIPEL